MTNFSIHIFRLIELKWKAKLTNCMSWLQEALSAASANTKDIMRTTTATAKWEECEKQGIIDVVLGIQLFKWVERERDLLVSFFFSSLSLFSSPNGDTNFSLSPSRKSHQREIRGANRVPDNRVPSHPMPFKYQFPLHALPPSQILTNRFSLSLISFFLVHPFVYHMMMSFEFTKKVKLKKIK